MSTSASSAFQAAAWVVTVQIGSTVVVVEGSDRARPLVSLTSCFWAIQQDRSSTAHS